MNLGVTERTPGFSDRPRTYVLKPVQVIPFADVRYAHVSHVEVEQLFVLPHVAEVGTSHWSSDDGNGDAT